MSCLWALHNHPARTGLRGLNSTLTVSSCNFFCGQDNQLTKCLSSSRSKPWEWPASNFSLQYYGWIIHWDHENKGNDRHPKKLWILLVGTKGNLQRTERRIWILMLGCKGLRNLTKWWKSTSDGHPQGENETPIAPRKL